MSEFEQLAIVLLRLVGLTLAVLALVQGVGNLLDGFNTWAVRHFGHFFKSQLLRPIILLAGALILLALSRPLGLWLAAGV